MDKLYQKLYIPSSDIPRDHLEIKKTVTSQLLPHRTSDLLASSQSIIWQKVDQSRVKWQSVSSGLLCFLLRCFRLASLQPGQTKIWTWAVGVNLWAIVPWDLLQKSGRDLSLRSNISMRPLSGDELMGRLSWNEEMSSFPWMMPKLSRKTVDKLKGQGSNMLEVTYHVWSYFFQVLEEFNDFLWTSTENLWDTRKCL
jgi:hypothetical protein